MIAFEALVDWGGRGWVSMSTIKPSRWTTGLTSAPGRTRYEVTVTHDVA
jgi:hypothetical protein